MKFFMRFCCRRAASVLLLALVLGMSGCESGGSHISDGFDFGDNNPDLYLAMGDSITWGYRLTDLSDAYPNRLAEMLGKRVINHAVSGSTSSYGATYAQATLEAYKPGYLLVLYGVNDLIHGYNIASVLANIRTMIAAAKTNQTIPVVATLTPVFEWYTVIENQVALLNAGIRLMCAEENVHVADFERAFNWRFEYMDVDGLHPNRYGHDLMAAVFYDILK